MTLSIPTLNLDFMDFFMGKWALQPVRRCCKGSIPTRVAPA
jgi:hypothetical protein